MTSDLHKQLPYSLEAEQSVLGAILIDPEKFKDIATILKADDFYIKEHGEMYDAMRLLFLQEQRTIDLVTLIDMLVQKGVYDEKSSRQYIKTICEIVPSSANIKDYASIVKNKSILRQLIGAADDISESAFGEQDSVSAILDMAEQKIYDIAEINEQKGFVHIKDILSLTMNRLNLLAKDPDSSSGTKTGFKSLDNVLIGMGKGDLILIGARPGMGKTAFATNIAINVAEQTNKTVCIFSLEMSNEQIVLRMLSSESGVSNSIMRSGKFNGEDDWKRLGIAAGKLAGLNIYIDDTANITTTAMKAKLRRMRGVGLVVIDYMQLMHTDTKIDNRVQEVSEISRAMKIMAKELNVPVICLSQLSRATEGRKDKQPALSDLRESGSIEQDADVVMFIFRDDYYDKNPEQQNRAQIIVAKNRHGSVETVEVAWDGQHTKFYSIDNEHQEP